MIRGIDHVVIAVPDPDAAATDLESSIGLAFTGGGRHDGLGTFNRIAWMADGAYLELIGVDDRDAAGRHPLGAAVLRTLDDHGSGLAAYALLDDQLDQTVAELRANDSSIGPATHGSRTNADGETAEWWTAMPERLGLDGLPFLISHVASGAEWSPEAQAARGQQVHPIGSPVILSRLDLAVADPFGRAADYEAQLGIVLWAVADLAVVELGPHVVRLVAPREMSVPAVITLGADAEPRIAEALGLRFDVERVEMPIPVHR